MSQMNKNPENKGPGARYALPFFVVLALLTVVSFIIPLRPEVSNLEKRKLAEFPEFSLEALASGDYFSDITLWYSDTFPGRENWMEAAQLTTLLHGYSEIAIEGSLEMSDEIPVVTVPPVTEAPKPEQETEPAQSEDAEATESTEATETTEAPQETEPTEPVWNGVDMANKEISLGAAIQIGDAGYNQLGFSQIYSDKYSRLVSNFADRMAEKGVRVISAPAPTAVGVMIEPEYLAQLKCARQDDMINYLHGNMSDNVIKVDTFGNLVKHNGEYIYFRTDHHWTMLGAYYAYQALCEAADMEAPALEEFELWEQGEFTGSLYGKVRWPSRLKVDTVDCYVPQGDITMYAYFDAKSSKGTQWPLIADKSGDDRNSKYSAFLASDVPMAHVVNESIPDAPNCVILKDSYGNCYVPFLTQNYHNVYALDYRKYWEHQLDEFVDLYDIDDVIVMPYLIATQSGDGTNIFEFHLG